MGGPGGLCAHPLLHPLPLPARSPPTLPPLHTHPFNHQVTMEEEDESRGKTEESGEDRSDGPPDRDPMLSPSAFILVRLLDAGPQGRRGWESRFQGPVPGPKGEAGLGVWTPLASLKGWSLVVGESGMASPRSRACDHLHMAPDYPFPSTLFTLHLLFQRAIQQAVGSSLQGDLPNDKGMMGSGSP